MRLIDADALTDELVAIQDATYMSTCTSVDECNGKRWMIARAIDAVKDTPEIDAAPVIRGEWVLVGYGKPDAWDCSECNVMVGRKYNYCPVCGADMRGEGKICPLR